MIKLILIVTTTILVTSVVWLVVLDKSEVSKSCNPICYPHTKCCK